MRISDGERLWAIYGDDRPALNADEFDTRMILNCRDFNPQEPVLNITPNDFAVSKGSGKSKSSAYLLQQIEIFTSSRRRKFDGPIIGSLGKRPVHIFATVYTTDGERGLVVGCSSMMRGWLVLVEGELHPGWYHEDELTVVG